MACVHISHGRHTHATQRWCKAGIQMQGSHRVHSKQKSKLSQGAQEANIDMLLMFHIQESEKQENVSHYNISIESNVAI